MIRFAGESSASRQAEAGLLLLVLLWALNFSVIKIGLAAIPPFGFNALRFPLAALLMAAVLMSRNARRWPARADMPRIVALGVIGNLLYQLLFITAMDHGRAGNASVILSASPIFIAIGTAWLGHESIRGRAWTGIGVTFLGITLVVGSGEEALSFGTETLVGDLMMVAAAAVWAIYTVGSRDLIQKYGSVFITAWTLWIGTILLVMVGLPDVIRLDAGVPVSVWGSVVYAGFLGLGLSYLLWYRGVRVLGNTRTASMGNLVPVLAILIAWPMLGEVPTVLQVVGASLVIAGVAIVRRSSGAHTQRVSSEAV